MNKGIIFGLGVLIGAAGGSAATYFLTKESFQAMADEEIESYAEHCEERIARYRADKKLVEDIDEKPAKKETNPEDEKINSNEGVKKYHHDTGLEGYGSNHIFEQTQSIKEKSEIKTQIDKSKKGDSKLINEITEDDFLNEDNKYDKYTVDVLLGDDSDICGIWGYGTDNEEFADKKFGQPIEVLLNNMSYDELLTYAENPDGMGALYLRNDELNIDFEFLIKDQREEDID